MTTNGYLDSFSGLSEAMQAELIEQMGSPLYYWHDGESSQRSSAKLARETWLGKFIPLQNRQIEMYEITLNLVERRIIVPAGRPIIPPNANSKRRHRIMRRWERECMKAHKVFGEWMQKHIEKVLVYGS